MPLSYLGKSIPYGSRGASVFHITSPRVNKGTNSIFQVLLWKFPPLFFLEETIFLSSSGKHPDSNMLPASVCLSRCSHLQKLPLGVFWAFSHSTSVAVWDCLPCQSLTPSWKSLQRKINWLEECLYSNDTYRFEWNIVFMIPTIYYSLCSFLLNKTFRDQG